MTAIETTTFKDAFRLLLLVSDVNPSRNVIRYHVRLFAGGICTEEKYVHAPYASPDDAPYRTLQTYVSKVASAPHVLVACGHGWMDLLTAFMPEAALASLRILDLRATAAAFAPEIKVTSFPEGFATAFGLSWRASEGDLPLALMEDLTWHLLHAAGNLGLDWPALLDYPNASRHLAPFERFQFDAESLASIPNQPGVYIMRAKDGETLYVGKSSNLQARVSSYFTSQKTVPEKIQRIWDQISDFEVQCAGSDLESILIEQQRIEELAPRVNVQRVVAEGRGRYGTPATTIVVLMPSATPRRLELFWIGLAGSTYQLRVTPGRPPLKQLRQLLASAREDRPPQKASSNLINWGTQGNEIASRVFGRQRTRMTWIETGAVNPETFIERLTTLMKKTVSTPMEPAEIRMHDQP